MREVRRGITAGSFLLFATLAIAQDAGVYITELDGSIDKESIPMSMALWSHLLLVARMEDQRATDGHFHLTRFVGLSDEAADQFIKVAREAIHEDRSLNANRNKELCEAKESLTTRADLAAEMLETDRLVEELRDANINKLLAIVDEKSSQRIVAWADDARSRIKVATGDISLMFEVEAVDPKEILKRKCARYDFM